mmetsp:Transcript_6495/g.25147  ORF Transcript_6495/g.25147 Transcript_6495/m.25147 type:complete len:225 (-) Transcript_6495:116-790(-)
MGTAESKLVRHRLQSLRQRHHDLQALLLPAAICGFRVHQEARTGGRRERHAALELGIIPSAEHGTSSNAMEAGPLLVKDVLAHAVALPIQRHHAQHLVVLTLGHQVHRLPAFRLAGGAAGLKSFKKAVLQEWIVLSGARVPLLGVHVRHRTHELYGNRQRIGRLRLCHPSRAARAPQASSRRHESHRERRDKRRERQNTLKSRHLRGGCLSQRAPWGPKERFST